MENMIINNIAMLGRKIIVLGCPGSGKSTFSKRLCAVTGLPLIHLDNIWWKSDRSHISREEFDKKLNEIIQEDAWIIDGDYKRTYEMRWKACDTMIFLDYSLEECMDGIVQRIGQERTDIPWIEQKLDKELMKTVQHYAINNRPIIYSLAEKYSNKQNLIFYSRAEANAWLRTLVDSENGAG